MDGKTVRITMRDVPMLDSDRELLRDEIEGFDDMTLEEFVEAKMKRLNELLDFYNSIPERKTS